MTDKPDHWVPEDYVNHASFVPQLTTKIVSLLAPAPTDSILDIGAGDGLLSLAIASKAAHVHVTDASAAFVKYADARIAAAGVTNMTTEVLDASTAVKLQIPAGKYNKVFSNAAYHWVFGSLPDNAARARAVKDVFDILPPGGEFVVECGGHGNIAEILVALASCVRTAWLKKGVDRSYTNLMAELSPWYFVPEQEVRRWYEDAGFTIEYLEYAFRPTTLNDSEDGMKGWIDTFGFSFWKGLTDDEKNAAIDDAIAILKPAVWIESLNQWIVNYVRCRIKAVRP
ncbi:S-adenosyl-L-methionine-dependent methyltransferase [Limtongia smithiae]|uniref:S-adenosyl-L-methionine-dependent methyltransferase n=1 Tax=Limtongia smithiae TaxID=1125753 RepID=UPI0034CF3DBB